MLAPQAADLDAIAALGTSPIVNLHVHYDRRVLDEPFAAAVGSPVQWLFDRTESSGADDGPAGRAVALGRRRGDRRAARRAARALPARARTAAPRRARSDGARRLRDPRAARDLPRCARDARAAAGPRTRQPGLYLAGAWTDTGWPATMEGAVRSGHAAAEALLADLHARRPAPFEPLGAAA